MVYQLADVTKTSKLFVVTICKLSLFRKSVVCRVSSHPTLWRLCAPLLGVRQDKCHGQTLYLYPQYPLGVMSCPSMDNCGNFAWSHTWVQNQNLHTNAMWGCITHYVNSR